MLATIHMKYLTLQSGQKNIFTQLFHLNSAFNRNITQATYAIFTFLVATLKKVKRTERLLMLYWFNPIFLMYEFYKIKVT